MTPPTRVLVIGAGYAGLLFTMRLAGKVPGRKVSITLVNASPTFTERLRLHQFATNQSIKWRSIAETLRGTGVRFVEGTVSSISTTRHEVVVAGRYQAEHVPYDYLVYALGSVTDRQRVPGVDRYAYTLAPSGAFSASTLRGILPSLQERAGHIVVCGGGATGIETAAELATAYPRLKVQLVTKGSLGEFLGKRVARYMRRSLERSGVAIRDHTTIAEVRRECVVTDQGSVIPCDLCVWTGGFVAPSLAREAGLDVNARDQVIIDPYMRSVSHPEIFAIGDAAHPREDPGVPVRMSAFTASIMGAHGADCLRAVIRGKAPKPLSFAYLGQAIALGRHDAIGFNNFPDDRPNRPYFTGWLAYHTRRAFVWYLTTAPRREWRRPGLFFWLGKGRYANAHRRHRADMRRDALQTHQA